MPHRASHALDLKTQRALCCDLLNEVRLRGEGARWLDFFAEGLDPRATQCVWTAHALQRQPIAASEALVQATRLTPETDSKTPTYRERIDIVAEVTNQQLGRVFSYLAVRRRMVSVGSNSFGPV